ncbi:sigma-70 family RNA polymerase sigma factor [Nocardioides zeae]|uniref:Sigma-70 family RNA polymerase sigma factor n=1 Tax=Nocardioides imazamoxiresistens TaxID=3231893 RepID=A0ABU3PU98_9ACTN|nr:sigma-70 family RNA polymerase sigma factor [Nocardioides zeae]MDT9592778.1 sigma-70 family RNA polymerase sigma factor [Nocardioides zeae]
MDEREFDEFYQASFGRVVNQVTAMIGDRDEAHECVQEAFVRAWAHRRRLARVDHPEAWVRTVAHRQAVSRWRRASRGRRDPDRAVAAPLTADGPAPDRVAVVAALRHLPAAQREALVLHHVYDLPVAQVARETGTAEGTIKARLSRGRAALAALLADDVPDLREGTTHA